MIELTVSQIEKAERMLAHIPGAAPRAMSNAINRATDSAKTEAARKAREQYYITHKDVLSTMKMYRASAQDLTASVVSRGNLIALPKFRVTPAKPQPRRKKPITVRVKRGQGGPVRKAFVAGMRSGHTGVFMRSGKKRFPIEQMFGPSVPQMLESRSVNAWVSQKANETLDKRLDHEINRVLEGQT